MASTHEIKVTIDTSEAESKIAGLRALIRELKAEMDPLIIAMLGAAEAAEDGNAERCVTCGASSQHWQPQHRMAGAPDRGAAENAL